MNIPIIFDIETTGLDYRKDEIFSYCLGDLNGEVSVHRLDGADRRKNQQILINFFEDTSKEKVCHNMHFELNFMKQYLVVPESTIWHDTMLMSQVLKNNQQSHALDYLTYHLADYPTKWDKEVSRLFKLYRNYKRIPIDVMTNYQIADGERTILLYKLLWPKIKEENLLEDYQTEIDTVKVTSRMERVGIRLNEKMLDPTIHSLEEKIRDIQVNIFDRFGRFINLNSEKQLTNLIYHQLKYPVLAISAKTGDPSTGKEVIAAFREMHPEEQLFDWILQQRSYIKGISTIKQYKKFNIDGILYPSIGTNEAVTGRQTSSNPNLQNVSRDTSLTNPYHIPLRQCFRCHEHCLLYLIDYQAIEMRLIIEAAQDEIMLDILSSGGDVHQEAMECFYGRDFILALKASDPKKFETIRSVTKNGHFGLGYGASMVKVASTLGLNAATFSPYYYNYKKRHPRIVGLLIEMIHEVKDKGYVSTPFGRNLYVFDEVAHAGLNYRIQGTAAGILKRAEVKVDNLLRKKYSDEVRLVLPVHDELIFKYPRKYLPYRKEVLTDISREMVDIPQIKVKLETEIKSTTTTWNNTNKEKL